MPNITKLCNKKRFKIECAVAIKNLTKFILMSIPSVDFGNRRSRIQHKTTSESTTRQSRRRITYQSGPKKPFLLNMHDEVSSDVESDEGMITVKSPRSLNDVYSDYESDSDTPPQENQVIWAAQNQNNTKKASPEIEPPKTELKTKVIKRTRITRKTHVSHDDAIKETENGSRNDQTEQKIEIIPDLRNNVAKVESLSSPPTGRTINDDTSAVFNDPSLKLRKNLSQGPPPNYYFREDPMILDPIPSEQQSYTVIRHKGTFGKLSFNFLLNDKTIFYAELTKDVLSNIFIITTKHPCTKSSSGYQGYVRVSGSRKRFTVVSKYLKPNDDREGCLLGCYFSKSHSGNRTLRIAMPPTLSPFFPISKRTELSRVAKAPEKSSRFVYYETVQSQADNFDADLVEKSIKNFIVRDYQKENILQFFKASENQFRVKCTAPFNRLMCFGLCIAMIYSKE